MRHIIYYTIFLLNIMPIFAAQEQAKASVTLESDLILSPLSTGDTPKGSDFSDISSASCKSLPELRVSPPIAHISSSPQLLELIDNPPMEASMTTDNEQLVLSTYIEKEYLQLRQRLSLASSDDEYQLKPIKMSEFHRAAHSRAVSNVAELTNKDTETDPH